MAQLYKVFDPEEPGAKWAATMTEARALVREVAAPFRASMHVHLVEVKADKAALVRLLATGQPTTGAPLRTWRGKTRGGLRPGDDAI